MKKALVVAIFALTTKVYSQDTKTSSSQNGDFKKLQKIENSVKIEDVYKYIGKTVSVSDSVHSTKFFTGASSLTLLNLGGKYPDQKLTIIIWGYNSDKFHGKPDEIYREKAIEVTGKVTKHEGKLQIEVKHPDQIQILNQKENCSGYKHN